MSAVASEPVRHRALWVAFRDRHLHDYGPLAAALWFAIVAVGLAAFGWSLVRTVADWQTLGWPVVATLVAVGVAALFATHIPRTKYSISVADVFIFLLLALQGAPLAVVAAGLDGLIGAMRTSRRVSSRISTPAAAATGMLVAATIDGRLVAAIHRAGLSFDAAASVAVVLVAPLPILLSMFPLLTMLSVKNGKPLEPRVWIADSAWMIITATSAAFVASMLSLNARLFGPIVLVVGGLVVFALILLVRITLRRREDERAAQDALITAAQADAERNQRRFMAAFTHAAIGMAIVDRSGRVVQVNNALSMLFGEQGEDLVGRTFNSLLHTQDAPLHAQRASEVAARRAAAFSMELRCRSAQGGAVWVALHCGQYEDSAGDERCLIYQLYDITSRQHAESRLQHIAYHDGLTDLANRNCFIERLALSMQKEAVGPASLFAVLFLDLDRFKVVNDSLGHSAGNELLCAVGKRLIDCVRPDDLVARLGGDEFVILMENLRDHGEARGVADRVLAALVEPLVVNGTEVVAGASIGLTFSDVSRRTVEEILRDADLAMYEAKNAGRGQIAVFDVSMHERVAQKLSLEGDLRRAIGEGKLTLQFQPIYELAPFSLAGFEALARWIHPERGPVSPAVFVALAEESGYVSSLTSWVLDRSLEQLARWDAMAPHASHLTMNVNLSGRDLARPALVQEVADLLERYSIAPQRLTLEITETTLMDRLDLALETMNALRALGVRFSIDDFGTGYSSLSYLSRLPIDSLKIDRSFVIALKERPHNVEIVKAIVHLGEALGRRIVAEGIETGEQLAMLRTLGVHYGQGYLLSRPIDAMRVPALLQLSGPGATGGAERELAAA